MKSKYITNGEVRLLDDLYIQYESHDSIKGKINNITELLNLLALEKELYYMDVNFTNSEIILSISYRECLVNFLKNLLSVEVTASLGYIDNIKYIKSIDELIEIIKDENSKIPLNVLSNCDIENVKSILLKYVYDETDNNYEKGTSDYINEFKRNLIKRLKHYQQMYIVYFYKTVFIDELINSLVDIVKCIICSYLSMDITDLDEML